MYLAETSGVAQKKCIRFAGILIRYRRSEFICLQIGAV
jgi:hypothetical protein